MGRSQDRTCCQHLQRFRAANYSAHGDVSRNCASYVSVCGRFNHQAGAGGLQYLDVGHPAMMVRLKGHPPLVDLPRARYVTQHLLHVDVLVPAIL